MDAFAQFIMKSRSAVNFALTDTSKLNLSYDEWNASLNLLNHDLGIAYAIMYGLPKGDEIRDKFVRKLNELHTPWVSSI